MGTLTDAEKTDCRRFCGYGAYGAANNSNAGARFFQAAGTLEFKLTNLSPSEESVLRVTHLANLYLLETDIVGSRSNLDTDAASVWKHNKSEVADRQGLFDMKRQEFCDFLGIAPGPGLRVGGSMQMVV